VNDIQNYWCSGLCPEFTHGNQTGNGTTTYDITSKCGGTCTSETGRSLAAMIHEHRKSQKMVLEKDEY
jgi:hypothetical protein